MGDFPRLIRNWGQIIGGENSAEVDSIASKIVNVDYKKIGYLPLTIDTFGDFDRKIIDKIPKDFLKPLK